MLQQLTNLAASVQMAALPLSAVSRPCICRMHKVHRLSCHSSSWWAAAGAASVMAPAVADPLLMGYKALYRTMLEDSKRGIARAMRVFAAPENFPVLVHCVSPQSLELCSSELTSDPARWCWQQQQQQQRAGSLGSDEQRTELGLLLQIHGKDRTGLVIALLLMLCDVDPQVSCLLCHQSFSATEETAASEHMLRSRCPASTRRPLSAAVVS